MDRFLGLLATILAVTVFTVTGQINTPCTTSMIASFTPCIGYVMGSSANGGSPTAGCCKAIESLMSTSMQCTCLIVTGNVPFSLPSQINQALAIRLPSACSSSVPVQCKATGVSLPPAGPALFVPPPPPRALPPTADSPELAPSPSGSVTTELAPTPSEMSPDDDTPEPDSRGSSQVALGPSAPTARHNPPADSGIKPVYTPASASKRLHCSPPIVLLMLAAVTVTSFREVFTF